MTLKYESEILFDLMKRDGDDAPSDVLPYESELKEKYLKQVEGAYPKLMDYRPEWLNYNLEAHLPADFPVETVSNVTEATVDNVVPYAYRSAILKGQTLVNLIASDTIVGKSGGSATFINNKLRVNFPNYNWSGITIKNTGMFKPSTKYTIIAKATNTTSFTIEIGHNNTSFNAFSPINDSRMVLQSGETGSIKVALITRDDLQIDSNVYNVLCSENPSSFSGDKFIDIELMIIEGDYTNVNIPYFEGMQSVKMPVLKTTGKNLFSGRDTSNKKHEWASFPITLEAGTYVASNNSKERITSVVRYEDNYEITTASIFTLYVRTTVVLCGSAENRDCFQLEKGSIPTSYEPYKSNILTVNEDVTLRGIGDVQDTLDCLTGEVTERICEIVFNGSENWEVDTVKTNTCVFKLIIKDMKSLVNHVICDQLPTAIDGDVEKIANRTKGNDGTPLFIALLKTKATNVNELTSYLSQNPITVQYLLETPVIKTVDLSIQDQDGNTTSIIRPIEGTMHLMTEGDTIKPLFSGEIPVEATTQNLASFIKEE